MKPTLAQKALLQAAADRMLFRTESGMGKLYKPYRLDGVRVANAVFSACIQFDWIVYDRSRKNGLDSAWSITPAGLVALNGKGKI